jgi:hypothetical protein
MLFRLPGQAADHCVHARAKGTVGVYRVRLDELFSRDALDEALNLAEQAYAACL